MRKNGDVPECQMKNIHMKRKNTSRTFGVRCCLYPDSLNIHSRCWFVLVMCNSVIFLIWKIKTNASLSLSPRLLCQSDINTIGPRKVGHVGCQGRVGGQNFNGQVPAECIHIDMFCAGPHGDLWLVLQHRGWFQRLSGSNKFKVQTPLQDHCKEVEFSGIQMMIVSQGDTF